MRFPPAALGVASRKERLWDLRLAPGDLRPSLSPSPSPSPSPSLLLFISAWSIHFPFPLCLQLSQMGKRVEQRSKRGFGIRRWFLPLWL